MCQVIVQMCTYCEQGCPQQKHCLHVCAFSFAHVQVLFARVHVWCAHVKLRYQAFAHLVCKFPILVCNCASLVFHVFLFKWLFASQANLSCMFLQTWIANNVQTWFARFAKKLVSRSGLLASQACNFRAYLLQVCLCVLLVYTWSALFGVLQAWFSTDAHDFICYVQFSTVRACKFARLLLQLV